jgi:hypothetical protein
MRKPIRAAVPCLTVGMLLTLTSLAQAQLSRTFVAGTGDDTNPCTRWAPCATFAAALVQTSAGGEITAIDAGPFGAVTISKAVTIDSDGAVAGIQVSGVNAIVINAGAFDAVTLRGLTLEGEGTGLNGIDILSAGSVRIVDCFIEDFVGDGIAAVATAPSSSLHVTIEDTVVSGVLGSVPNGFALYVNSTVPTEVALNRVLFADNSGGLRVDEGDATVRDSMITGSAGNGIVATSSPGASTVNVESTVLSYNFNGIVASGTAATVRISDTSVLKNASNGLLAVSSGQIVSWGNNKNAGNGTNGAPTSTIAMQ